jgi:hypothetical protein
MGIANMKPSESEEVISAREYRAELILEQRKRRHKAYTSMVQRVLSSGSKSLIETLPPEVFFIILQMLAPDIMSLLAVSAKWHVKILETLDCTFSAIESQFAMVHSNLICFKRSYTDFNTMIVSDKKGIRVDRVIVAEVLPYLNSKTIKIRYNYKNFYYKFYQKAEFKFDCTNSTRRSVWCHRDECKFHGEDLKRAFTQQIPLVLCGSYIEIAVNWYNLSGNVNLDSIQWQTPEISDTRTILKNLQIAPRFPRGPQNDSDGINKKLYLYNVSRHCELELSQTEWYDAKYYLKPSQVYCYDFFYPFLRMVSSEFAGVDVTVSRNTYRAEKPGIIPDSFSRIGIQVEVKLKGEELVQEVKRMGLVYDRHRPIELTLGDIFVLYISRGG